MDVLGLLQIPIRSRRGDNITYYSTFKRSFPSLEPSDLCTSIQAGTGRFELCLNNKIVLSGNIFVLDGPRRTNSASAERTDNDGGNPIVSLDRDEIYASLEQFGYCVGDVFKTLRHINIFEDGAHFAMLCRPCWW